MNVYGGLQKAVDGCIIPPRTFMQMVISAAQGAYGLLSEENRAEFMESIERGTIDEAVISQASGGAFVMLSLFHDLQNPLFKRNEFNATEFLNGVGPALERFHNVSGSLENVLQAIREEAQKNPKETEGNEENTAQMKVEVSEPIQSESDKNEAKDMGALFPPNFPKQDFFELETSDKSIVAVLEHEWKDEAKTDQDSLAGQLSRMLTDELFHHHEVSAKTAFLLDSLGTKMTFKEDSCKVNNVALLSARSFKCIERDQSDSIDEWGERTNGKYELVDYELSDHQLKKKNGGIAAQVEVLYDVTQEFVREDASTQEKETLEMNSVAVAVMEAWLSGGPDNELKWRLALQRPAYEFRGIQ